MNKIFKTVNEISNNFDEKAFKEETQKPEVLKKLLMTREKENNAIIELVKSKMTFETIEEMIKRKS